MVTLQDIDERLRRLEDRTKINFFEIEKRLSKLESGGEPDEILELKERIAELEDLQMLLELENTKLKEALGVENVLTNPPVTGGELEKRISEIEKKISYLEKSGPLPSIDISEIENKIVHDLEKRMGRPVSNELEKKVNEELAEINELKNSIHSIIDKKINSRLEQIEKRIDEIRRTNEESIRKDVEERLEEMRRDLDKIKVEEIAKHESSLNEKIDELSKRINSLEFIAKEKTDIGNIEKRLSRFENSIRKEIISEIRKEVDRQRVGIDFEERLLRLRKEIRKELEKDVERMAIKFLADKLNKFAKAIDKRMPNYVTVDEYRKDIHYLDEKLNKIKSPDLSELINRINELDRRIREISLHIKGVSKAPIIIE